MIFSKDDKEANVVVVQCRKRTVRGIKVKEVKGGEL
jgi:hypothetical protein